MWKWMGVFLRKINLLRSLLNLHYISIAKLPPRLLEPWFVLWSLFLPRLLCNSINLPYDHAWNTVVMSGLVLLVATWNCWISCKNGHAGLLVLHLLPLFNPCLIFEMYPAYVFSIANTLVDVQLNWFNWFHFCIPSGGLLVILIDWVIFPSPFLDVTRMSMSAVSFLPQLDSGILCL